MKHFTTIYAVVAEYEAPMAYFSTLEAAAEYRDSIHALYAAWLEWADSPISEVEDFTPPAGMEDLPHVSGRIDIDAIRVY